MSGVWMRGVRALWTSGATIALVCGLSVSSWAVYDSGFDPVQSQGAYVAESGVNNVIQLPDSGVLHYDSFTVPDGVTVIFEKNADNTGVWLLSGGDIIVDGTINLQGKGGVSKFSVDAIDRAGGYGGPGGSDGGLSIDNGGFGVDGTVAQRGLGPGGGVLIETTGAYGASPIFGSNNPDASSPWAEPGWIPLSGGGGAAAWANTSSQVGGGGGGLITMASNGAISVEGKIDVSGLGHSGSTLGGAGGIRLIADTISGSGVLDLSGGTNSSPGYARLEALYFEGQLINNIDPNHYEPILSTPQVAVPYPEAERPRLEIATVNGMGPANVRGDWPPNSILTTGVPVEVVVEAEYMPVGVPGLVVRMNPAGAEPIVIDDAVLEGSVESSSVTVTFALPQGIRVGTFEAWWVEPMAITNN